MKLTDLMEKAIEDFPRLCYLSETDILAVMSNLGNIVPLLPIINKVFPAISLIRFTEIKPKNLTTVSTTTTEEEGVTLSTDLIIVWFCHSCSSTQVFRFYLLRIAMASNLLCAFLCCLGKGLLQNG